MAAHLSVPSDEHARCVGGRGAPDASETGVGERRWAVRAGWERREGGRRGGVAIEIDVVGVRHVLVLMLVPVVPCVGIYTLW